MTSACVGACALTPGAPAAPSQEAAPCRDSLPSTVLARTTRSPRRIDAWSLVLVAKQLHPLVFVRDGAYELHVPYSEGARALAELASADAEERAEARVPRARPLPAITRHAWWGSALMSALLVVCFAVTGGRSAASPWFSAGASDASRVLSGELYRTVTALTLHADLAHLVSNASISVLVIAAVMRSTGVGLGALSVVLAGALGNWLNAYAHYSMHRSVGFSTAVFAAIGLAGALAFAEARAHPGRRRPAWTALGGSVALLAALGASEKSDVFAHLFGGMAGMALGLALGLLAVRPKSTLVQALLGASAAALVAGSWLLALR
jgi:rhomboid protease GluP